MAMSASGSRRARRLAAPLLPCFGKQQPEQEVHDREEQRKAQQPGDAVDGLLGQGDGVEIELAWPL